MRERARRLCRVSRGGSRGHNNAGGVRLCYHADEELDHRARASAETEAAVVENVHRDLEAAANLAEDVLDRDLDIVEKDLSRTATEPQRARGSVDKAAMVSTQGRADPYLAGVGALDAELGLGLSGGEAAKAFLNDEGSDLVTGPTTSLCQSAGEGSPIAWVPSVL